MTKMTTSNATILESVMDQMVFAPSPSPHTCSMSYSALRTNEYVQNGFIHGGIDFFAAGDDILDSHRTFLESFMALSMSAASDDNPKTWMNMSLTFRPKSKTAESLLRGWRKGMCWINFCCCIDRWDCLKQHHQDDGRPWK